MATLQRKCVVYFIRAELSRLIKIGVTSKINGRLVELQRVSPDRLSLLGTLNGDLDDERSLHQRFKHLRRHGEWFVESPELLRVIGEIATPPPATTPKRKLETAERIELNADKDETGCWIWRGKSGSGGYGRTKIAGQVEQVHRAAWLLWRGDIPKGQFVRHLCGRRLCINPDHLELSVKYRRPYPRGAIRKLNANQIQYVRSMSPNRSARQIAKDLGISHTAVQRILSGHTYREVQ